MILDFKRSAKGMEIEERRAKVAALLVRGVSYRNIAIEVGVKSTQTVWADVQAIMDEWRKYHLSDINKLMVVELQKTLEVEAAAWEEWERSKTVKDKVRVTEAVLADVDPDDPTLLSLVGGLIPTERQTTTEGRLGNPAYLAIIDKMMDKRARLLGLYAPERLQMASPEDEREFGAQAKSTLIGRLLSPATIAAATDEDQSAN